MINNTNNHQESALPALPAIDCINSNPLQTPHARPAPLCALRVGSVLLRPSRAPQPAASACCAPPLPPPPPHAVTVTGARAGPLPAAWSNYRLRRGPGRAGCVHHGRPSQACRRDGRDVVGRSRRVQARRWARAVGSPPGLLRRVRPKPRRRRRRRSVRVGVQGADRGMSWTRPAGQLPACFRFLGHEAKLFFAWILNLFCLDYFCLLCIPSPPDRDGDARDATPCATPLISPSFSQQLRSLSPEQCGIRLPGPTGLVVIASSFASAACSSLPVLTAPLRGTCRTSTKLTYTPVEVSKAATRKPQPLGPGRAPSLSTSQATRDGQAQGWLWASPLNQLPPKRNTC